MFSNSNPKTKFPHSFSSIPIDRTQPINPHPHYIIHIILYLQLWAVHTIETWMSRQVLLAPDITEAGAPVDPWCHMDWTTRVSCTFDATIHTNHFCKYFIKIGAPRYQSLDRGGLVDHHDREFIPIREPRDRSRDRSLERGLYLEDELYGRSARQSPNPIGKFTHTCIYCTFSYLYSHMIF